MSSEAWPFYSDDELLAVETVLRSGHVNQWGGDRVATFQSAFAEYCSAPHAIALANGTVALEVALRALGIQPGDEVIVASRSFVASASCVVNVGACPVFADIDHDSQNMTAETIRPLIGPKTRAVIPVHVAGWPCDMPAIMELAEQHQLKVIEDCAQALGAKISGKPIGTFGHAATFSFCQDKIISTGGEGGMVLFRDTEPANWAASYKDHGKNFSKMQNHCKTNEFAYVHDMVGSNYRMTEMQAAIGLVQLTKLDEWILARTKNAEIWNNAFDGLKCLELLTPPDNFVHAYYRFYAYLKPDQLRSGVDRSKIMSELVDNDIAVFSGSCPEIYLEEAFSDLDVETRPVAHAIAERTLAFTVHPTLDTEKLKRRAAKAAEVLTGFQAS